MSDPVRLAVTGATGRVGGMVARQLADAQVPMRLVVRDPSRAPTLPGTDVWQASYDDEASALGALDGIETLFMVSAAENKDRVDEHTTFVDAAARAGVQHIVYTSFYGAAADAVFTLGRDHFATEEHIVASGMGHTFLRDNFYLNFLAYFAGDEGVIRGPAGQGRLSAVAQEDVAAVATAVLLAPTEHLGRTYHLTGPEALTFDEAAAILTSVTGTPVRYVDETVPEAYASRAHYGAEDWQVEAWVSTYLAIARGECDGVSDDVERVSGRAPYSLEQLLRMSG